MDKEILQPDRSITKPGTRVTPESDDHEYKSLQQLNHKKDPNFKFVIEICKKIGKDWEKEFNAMLNSKCGTVHFGITDDCYVEEGIPLTEKDQDEIRMRVSQSFKNFFPSVIQPSPFTIHFIEMEKGLFRFDVDIKRESSLDTIFMSREKTVAYCRSGGRCAPIPADAIRSGTQISQTLEDPGQHDMSHTQGGSDMSHTQGGSSDTLSHVQPPRHKLSEHYRPQFDKKRGELIILVDKIKRNLEEKRISLDALKSFLRCYKELRDDIEATKSIDEAINVVCDHTPVGNTHYLLTIAKKFDLQSAIVLIKEFDNSVDTFCEQIPKTHSYANFITDSSKDPQQSEIVEFVLEWDADDERLNDIQVLLRKAFHDKAEFVKVIRMFPTKSICVICYAPPHFHEELKKLVKKNEKELREYQVLSVTIGGEVVLKRQEIETKDDEVVKDDTGIVSEQLHNFSKLISDIIHNEDPEMLKSYFERYIIYPRFILLQLSKSGFKSITTPD